MDSIHSVGELANLLKTDCSLIPVVAAEIEFYLPGILAHKAAEDVVKHIQEAANSAGLNIASASQEKGEEQFEVSFPPAHDAKLLVQQIEQFKIVMRDAFARYGITADFSAKPFAEQPGSGLHIHIHLEDSSGKNMFTRAGDEIDDPFSDALLHSLGGMLVLMNPCMKFFVPAEKSFTRFMPKSNAPMTVSWGTNNRTVALRLPTKAITNKHIEHRVAGSDADISAVMGAVLAGVHYGLTNKCDPGEPTYGDASLAQYGLPALARNMAEAERFFEEHKSKLQIYLN